MTIKLHFTDESYRNDFNATRCSLAQFRITANGCKNAGDTAIADAISK